MKRNIPVVAFFGVWVMLLAAVSVWPHLDLSVSHFFYTPAHKFFLADQPAFLFLHWLAVEGAWTLGIWFAICAGVAALVRKPMFKLGSKTWLFLFLALILGPVLIANVGLKDHWGRARPRDISEFGGHALFSPALMPQAFMRSNGSFVSGDAAFGFFLPCLAYAAPVENKRGKRRHLSRYVFWTGMGAGFLFGLARLAMGAHFISDTLFAGFLMLTESALLHAVMFGKASTAAYWREWTLTGGQSESSSGAD